MLTRLLGRLEAIDQKYVIRAVMAMWLLLKSSYLLATYLDRLQSAAQRISWGPYA